MHQSRYRKHAQSLYIFMFSRARALGYTHTQSGTHPSHSRCSIARTHGGTHREEHTNEGISIFLCPISVLYTPTRWATTRSARQVNVHTEHAHTHIGTHAQHTNHTSLRAHEDKHGHKHTNEHKCAVRACAPKMS